MALALVNYTWRKKSISSQSFLLSIKVLNWRYTNKKIKKGDQKNYTQILTQLGGAHHSESGWIMFQIKQKKIFHKDTTEIWESNDN